MIHKDSIKGGKGNIFFLIRFPSPIFLFFIFMAWCLTAGCGYQFRSTGDPVGIALDSIAIPLFSSTSSFLGVEGDFTRIVREEFMSSSRIRLEGRDSAQAVLSGRICSITTDPLTYNITQQTIHGFSSTDEVTSSRKLKVTVEATLTDMRTGKVIWQDSGLTGEASFSVDLDPLRNRYNQRQAIISIARDLASQIYSRTMERF